MPALAGGRVHVLPAQAPLPLVDVICYEQDTAAVLAPAAGPLEPPESVAALVEEMVRQRPLRPGTVVSRPGRPRRLDAVVHDLECEPSWSGRWVRDCLDQVLALVADVQARSLALQTLGAMHGRYPMRAFANDLRAALAGVAHLQLEDLWLMPPAAKMQRLCAALQA